MAYLLIHGEEQRGFPFGLHLVLGHGPGQLQQHSRAELVVQKAAADIAGGRYPRPGVQADHIAVLDAQRQHVFPALDVFIQQNLQRLDIALALFQLAVHVNGGVLHFHHAGILTAVPGDDSHIFRLHGLTGGASQQSKAQSAIGFDLPHHQAQRIYMSSQCQRVALAAQRTHHAALAGTGGGEAHFRQLIQQPVRYIRRIAGRASDRQQVHRLIDGVLCIHIQELSF